MVNNVLVCKIILCMFLNLHHLNAVPSLNLCSSTVKNQNCILQCLDSTVSFSVSFEHPNNTLQGSCPIAGNNFLCDSGNYTIYQSLPYTYLNISSLDKNRDEGEWLCKHGLSSSPAMTLSVPSPIGVQKTPHVTITESKLNITCEMSCQYPTKNVSVDVIYAEEGLGSYGPFPSKPTVITDFTNKTGCDNYESNYKAVFTFSKSDNGINSLVGKKLTCKCNFTHSIIQTSTGDTGPAASFDFVFRGPTTESTLPGTILPPVNGTCNCPVLLCVGEREFCVLWIIVIAVVVVFVGLAVCILRIVCGKRKQKSNNDNNYKMTIK